MLQVWCGAAGGRSGGPGLRGSRVHGEALGARTPGSASSSRTLRGGRAGASGGGGGRAGGEGRGAAHHERSGPWSKPQGHSGLGWVARGSYCPRRMGGNCAG